MSLSWGELDEFDLQGMAGESGELGGNAIFKPFSPRSIAGRMGLFSPVSVGE
ncbi:hypothetical protein [Nitrosomonas sp. Nm33]|uniref:hypothetical protein n=1 Tax=Nitrosomonas sp. Nm33 TaxID=133724 RepID=UPI0015A2662B|nr:hypothetical protein [Nitrosomonas sp. Nm33]